MVFGCIDVLHTLLSVFQVIIDRYINLVFQLTLLFILCSFLKMGNLRLRE